MQATELLLDGGLLRYLPQYLSASEADRLFKSLQCELDWQQEFIHIHGREIAMPRLSAWIGDPGASYHYSGKTYAARPWHPALLALRNRIQLDTGLCLNAVLANLYRDGSDSVSWHADSEHELQPRPQIASISLGTTRRFQLRHKRHRELKQELQLEHGSLLLMLADTQANWKHQLPKTRRRVGPRINLTFRLIQHVLED